MCVCMCLCVCAYIHACVHVHVCVCMYVCMHVPRPVPMLCSMGEVLTVCIVPLAHMAHPHGSVRKLSTESYHVQDRVLLHETMW